MAENNINTHCSVCKSQSASTTLSAIGMDEEDIHSCIRLTFSGTETGEELDYMQ